jgi:ABC-type transport system involved in multi-copper enzyme maturation permease subunit
VRDKILYTLLFFAVLMIAGSVLVADLTVGEYGKIIRDLGLASISLFGLMIAVFVGIGLVYKEIERKTIYTIVSKPVRRWEFIVGKYGGLILTLATEVALMTVAFVVTLLFTQTSFEAMSIAAAIWLIFVELLVVTAIAILFGCFSTPTLSALFTIGLVVVGRLTPELKLIANQSEDPLLQWFGNVGYRILPDLGTFNLRAPAALGVPVEWEYIAYATGYGFLWAAVLLLGAAMIFRYRDFA